MLFCFRSRKGENIAINPVGPAPRTHRRSRLGRHARPRTHPRLLGTRSSRVLAGGAGLLVFLAVYALVVTLYGVSDNGQRVSLVPTGRTSPIAVHLELRAVDPASQHLQFDLRVIPHRSLVSDTGELTETIRALVAPSLDSPVVTFLKGSMPSAKSVTLIASGDVEQWPFDSYRIVNPAIRICPGSCDESSLSAITTISDSMPGWTLTDPDDRLSSPASLSFSRSVSTAAFGLILLSLLICTSVLSLAVSISTAMSSRKVETSLLSWMAALLFATIPLRSFLPGAPPVGSWIDYLVVLWVIAAQVVSLAIYVTCWFRQSRTTSLPRAIPPALNRSRGPRLRNPSPRLRRASCTRPSRW